MPEIRDYVQFDTLEATDALVVDRLGVGTGYVETSLVTNLTPTGVIAGSYTLTDLTVNEFGQITTASNGTGSGGVTSFDTRTGDVTLLLTDVTGVLPITVAPGTYNNANVTVNQYGIIQAITAGAQQPFGVAFGCQDISTKSLSTIIAQVSPSIAWTLPAGVPNGHGKCTAPSADTDFIIQVNGTPSITARWASGSTTPTFILAAHIDFLATDYLDLVTPSNLNGMTGPFSLTLIGLRS